MSLLSQQEVADYLNMLRKDERARPVGRQLPPDDPPPAPRESSLRDSGRDGDVMDPVGEGVQPRRQRRPDRGSGVDGVAVAWRYNHCMSDRISIDPAMQHGKPVIRGTRVPVARILGSLAGGMTQEQIADEYGVTTDDIAAALEFATELVDEEQFHPLPTR